METAARERRPTLDGGGLTHFFCVLEETRNEAGFWAKIGAFIGVFEDFEVGNEADKYYACMFYI
jgi:hypothetical protein